MSQSQISKFETGKKTPKLVDVERILRALDAPPELVTEVTALARIANTEWQDKRSSWRRGMEKRQTELASLESEATELRYFLPAMITGLLATPEYIRASLSHTPGDPSKTITRKLERQAVLYDTTKTFGRSLIDLVSIIDGLRGRGVGFKVLTGALSAVDTTSADGRPLFFQIIAAMAEFERSLIKDRTKAGLAAAKAQGRTGGRPTVITDDLLTVAKARKAKGESVNAIAKALGVSRATLYRHLPDQEKL